VRDDGDYWLGIGPRIHPENPYDLPFEPACYATTRPCSVGMNRRWLLAHRFPDSLIYRVEPGQSKADVVKRAGIGIFVDDNIDVFTEINRASGKCCCYRRRIICAMRLATNAYGR